MRLVVERRKVERFLLQLIQVRRYFLAIDGLVDDRSLERLKLHQNDIRRLLRTGRIRLLLLIDALLFLCR